MPEVNLQWGRGLLESEIAQKAYTEAEDWVTRKEFDSPAYRSLLRVTLEDDFGLSKEEAEAISEAAWEHGSDVRIIEEE